MILLNYSRHICFSESSMKFQKNLYSRFSYVHFTCWKRENNLRRNINLCIEKFYPQFRTWRACNTVEEHSAKVLKSWSQQLEFITAFHIRRTFQMINVYKRWWGSLAESFTVQRFVNQISKKRYYFTACFAPFFEWSNERISPEELTSLLNELHKVREQAHCESEYPIVYPDSHDTIVDTNSKCNCIRCQHVAADGWDLYYESNALKIWRKVHLHYKDEELYVYKVYGHFQDVTATDFFQVQVDTNYRKEWDPNAIQLEVVDSDTDTNSDIVYWEFLFPRMFYNRDYVCNRRYEINEEKQYIAIVSRSVDHPACPEKPPIHRVREYWSHCIIRPTNGSFDEPGIEFTITYFDNPELLIPSSLAVWYTITGMPEYLKKQRHAALLLAERRRQYEKGKEKAARDEARLAVLNKDPEWSSPEGPPKRVLLF